MKGATNMKTVTVKLKNGVTVLGKTTKAGNIFPKTFANRSQARNAAEKAGLNADDALRQWGRPWFVAVPADFNTEGSN